MTLEFYCIAGLRMGWAKTSPAHGPTFFRKQTMGWAGLERFYDGLPWAKNFGPWFQHQQNFFRKT